MSLWASTIKALPFPCLCSRHASDVCPGEIVEEEDRRFGEGSRDQTTGGDNIVHAGQALDVTDYIESVWASCRVAAGRIDSARLRSSASSGLMRARSIRYFFALQDRQSVQRSRGDSPYRRASCPCRGGILTGGLLDRPEQLCTLTHSRYPKQGASGPHGGRIRVGLEQHSSRRNNMP